MALFQRLMPNRQNTLITSGPFDTLPLEIIQYIASCLPASGAASFALCNHYLSQAVGAQSWTNLSPSCQRAEREVFLQLLDRDLPHHLFCHRCALLHLPQRPGVDERRDDEQYRRMRRRRCFDNDFQARTYYYLSSSFRFEHVQMAMKLHHLGLDVQNYLTALPPVVKGTCQLPNLKIFEARIVADEMIVRSQHWLLWPAGHRFQLSQQAYPHPQVCAHLETSPHYQDDNVLTDLLQCKVEHINRNQDPCPRCTGLKQCWACPTEMQIDIKVFESQQGTALVVTKWLALGAGKSPFDPKWRSHFLDQNFQPARKPYPFEPGSIQRAFEQQQAAFDFESPLTPELARLLLSK
jgi:hypothetical protein